MNTYEKTLMVAQQKAAQVTHPTLLILLSGLVHKPCPLANSKFKFLFLIETPCIQHKCNHYQVTSLHLYQIVNMHITTCVYEQIWYGNCKAIYKKCCDISSVRICFSKMNAVIRKKKMGHEQKNMVIKL